MTNLEFIRSRIPDFLVNDSIIKANLSIQKVGADEEFISSNELQVYLAYAECLKYILRLPASISQGGFSMSAVDKGFYEAELKNIYVSYGLEDKLSEFLRKPDITNAGEWD